MVNGSYCTGGQEQEEYSGSLLWDIPFCHWLWRGYEVYSHQVCRWHQIGRNSRICSRTVLLYRRTYTGQTNGPIGAIWNSTRAISKSCTWKLITPTHNKGWGVSLQKRPECPGRQQAECKPAACLGSREHQKHSGLD